MITQITPTDIDTFEQRLNDLIASYESIIHDLKAEIIRLEAELAAYRRFDVGQYANGVLRTVAEAQG
jgi:uncharacterized protein YutD